MLEIDYNHLSFNKRIVEHLRQHTFYSDLIPHPFMIFPANAK